MLCYVRVFRLHAMSCLGPQIGFTFKSEGVIGRQWTVSPDFRLADCELYMYIVYLTTGASGASWCYIILIGANAAFPRINIYSDLIR